MQDDENSVGPLDPSPIVIPKSLEELVASQIYIIRNQRVMLDRDLAVLYGVETRVLKQSVRRNIDRFPEDFMFQLTEQELADWRSHFVTSNLADRMGLRYLPFAFTEHGIAMLSGVLRSERAIEVNIHIVRTFIRLRRLGSDYEELRQMIQSMQSEYDEKFQAVFRALDQLLIQESRTPRQIGFTIRETEEEDS